MSPPTAKTRSAGFWAALVLTVLGFAVAPYLIFHQAPNEPTMGFIQRIFYFHVPCAWAMFLAAILAGFGGAAQLFWQRAWGQRWVAAGSELAVLFGILVLISGPLWAKIAWGHYWVWDVRLTTVFLLFLVFIAVMVVERYAGSNSRRITAALALFGAADVPLIYASVRLWKTIHPENTVVATLDPEMRPAFWISMASFTLLFALLWQLRCAIEVQREQLDRLWRDRNKAQS